MDRRGFLLAVAAGLVAATAACDAERPHAGARTSLVPPSDSAGIVGVQATSSAAPSAVPSASLSSTAMVTPSASPVATLPGVAGTWSPSPSGAPPGFLNSLPGVGRDVALTIDDGTSSEVVGAYVDFLESSGVRLTFFVNGVNPSWSDHARRLQPLVEFGQVQLGNHTWSHPDVTKLSDRSLADEINRNGTFIRGLYGVDARPYFRPPYGYHNAHTDRVAAGLGYTTQTLWYGSFGDSGVLTEAELMNLARQWLLPQHIVIGHANHPTVTRLYGQLLDLITERQLRTVTLDDIFTRPHQ